MKPSRKQTALAERAGLARARRARRLLQPPAAYLSTLEREYAEEIRALAKWIGTEARKEHARGWGKRSEERLRQRARKKLLDIDVERVTRIGERKTKEHVMTTIRKLAGAKVAKRLVKDELDRIHRTLTDARTDTIARSFIDLNTKLITGLADHEISTIAEIIDKNQGARWEDIAPKIQERVDVGENRANLIARDQVLSLNAKLTKYEHKELGITDYVWNATEDSRARQWHLDLDGKRYSYDDPPMGGGTTEDEPGNPGEGINCRCQAIPVIPLFEDL